MRERHMRKANIGIYTISRGGSVQWRVWGFGGPGRIYAYFFVQMLI
ncbi:hypothetical protein AZE42_06466 [Rhizopogon vesiculosus]|uniref:Uncharacterized protein n=1 Tax=Rhizopogon vesiculosus TaxID=180088 RepID=A0A1J8QKE3_9AGAM|nr:hypothetical protein AZE42_06466 [Rhizopogon vesiculosus]